MGKQTLSDRLIHLMKRESLSSQQLATKIDKHVTTIDRIKHGVTNPPDATLRRLADALNTSYEYLTTGTVDTLVLNNQVFGKLTYWSK